MPSFEIHVVQPCNLDSSRLSEVLLLIVEGGEVNPIAVKSRLLEAALIAYAVIDGTVAASASIKRPTDNDFDNAFVRAESPLHYRDYPHELGYAVVAAQFRGRHIGGMLWERLAPECSSMNLFATVREDNIRARTLLSKCGFQQSGKPFQSRNGVDALLLFVRSEQTSNDSVAG